LIVLRPCNGRAKQKRNGEEKASIRHVV